ncbi:MULTISPECIES: hypothetical protein [unclassified Psychrobacter]|uniref:hypothetical protein n=1 Tax=unclassified Psychrobacter TaxID=196806 RepID=UPI0040384693
MKIVNIIISGVCLFSLTACGNLQNWNSDYLSGGDYLSDDQGLVADCQGNYLGISNNLSDADLFWQDNNLPKGTNDYVCKDGRAYLPNKVTDCNGSIIIKKYGSIEKFRMVNNLPDYTTVAFICEGSSIRPSPDQLK